MNPTISNPNISEKLRVLENLWVQSELELKELTWEEKVEPPNQRFL